MADKTCIVDWKTITEFVNEVFIKYGILRRCTYMHRWCEADRRVNHGVNRFSHLS